ncbi:MAG: hypothetical protein J1E61_03045 [Lachnospiraceae bacterium]|nr:hypothetical protein [Lachnospiraceae bacterium]
MDLYPQPQKRVPRIDLSMLRFLSASAMCAVISFLTQCFLPLSMIFASLAIMFAILSKGRLLRMHSIAKASTGIAVFSIILSISMTVYSFVVIFTDPTQREVLNRTYEQMYGVTFDEAFDEAFGDLNQQYGLFREIFDNTLKGGR